MKLIGTKKRVLILLFLASFLICPFGCSREGEGEKSVVKEEGGESGVVAKVGNSRITVTDFRNYLSNRPMPYRSRVSKEDLEKRLNDMVLQEVLYQEALRLKLDQNPDVKRRIRQMLTQKLMDEQINKREWGREITEEVIQAYYDKHQAEFNRPAQFRLADVFIATPPGAGNEEREKLREKAEKVLAEALAVKGERRGFGSLIRKYSDTPENYRKGDTGFFDIEGQPVGIDKSLAQAAFKLERVGNMAEQVIETPGGFHVVMLIGKRSAIQRPLEAVRGQLEQRIRREAVTEARKAYIGSVTEKAEVEINPEVMTGILEELNKKQGTRQASSTKEKSPSSRSSAEAPPFPGKQN
jgi:parvulin-like peptidyl-prolyl isomerase